MNIDLVAEPDKFSKSELSSDWHRTDINWFQTDIQIDTSESGQATQTEKYKLFLISSSFAWIIVRHIKSTTRTLLRAVSLIKFYGI